VTRSLGVTVNVEMSKRYRHGVYHFQAEYFDKKYMPFMNSTGSVEWVRNLHATFFRYLNEWFKAHDLHGAPKSSVQDGVRETSYESGDYPVKLEQE
jgi:hypothetical protein